MSDRVGCISITASIFSTLAFALCASANFGCDTIHVQPLFGTGESLLLPERPFGPFYMRDTFGALVSSGGSQTLYIGQACAYYPEGTVMDANWNNARALAITAIVIGGLTSFLSYLPPCFGRPGAYAPILGSFFMLTLIFQGCTFLFLNSNACNNNEVVNNDFIRQIIQDRFPNLEIPDELYSDTCVWGWGTRTNIAGCVFWFLAGMVTCMLPVMAKKEAAGEAVPAAGEEDKAADVEEQPAAEVEGGDDGEAEKEKTEE